MRLNSMQHASPCQDLSQSLSGLSRYLRAFGCARCSSIEIMLVIALFISGWLRPRFLLGEMKVRPVRLSPTKLSKMTGFSRSRIHDSLRSLSDGRVFLVDEKGQYRINPRWQEWMHKDGRIRIHPHCHGYVLNGDPSDHECKLELVAVDVPSQAQNGVPETAHVPEMAVPETAHPERRAISSHARPEDLPCIHPSIGEVTEVSLNVCVNSLVPSAQVAHAKDWERAEPFSHTHTPESETSHPLTEALGEEKSPDPGQLDGPSSPMAPNPDSTPESLPAVHPNNHDHTHPENAHRVARYGSSFEGKCTPDPERLAVARKLVEEHMGANDGILCGIGLNKYRYESAWIVKALKRTIATKQNEHGHCPVRNFRYVEIILSGWKDAEGPESGPEDAFDDRMQLFPPKPKGARVPDAHQPAQPELTTEEKSRIFQENLHRLYPHFAQEREPAPRFRGPEPDGYVPVFRTTIEPIPAGTP